MMTRSIDKRSGEPPDTGREPSGTIGNAMAHSEWPYFVFVAGILLFLTLRALLFS
jgi:hypothetical protein